jgi:phosphoketolase
MTQTINERKPARKAALSDTELGKLDALWRASNYLSVGQIYLMGNPLLPPLRRDVKPRPRSLGDARPQLHLHAPEPGDQDARG